MRDTYSQISNQLLDTDTRCIRCANFAHFTRRRSSLVDHNSDAHTIHFDDVWMPAHAGSHCSIVVNKCHRRRWLFQMHNIHTNQFYTIAAPSRNVRTRMSRLLFGSGYVLLAIIWFSFVFWFILISKYFDMFLLCLHSLFLYFDFRIAWHR